MFSDERECWLCRSPRVHKHHIYGGSRRSDSEREGCWVYLCPEHHNMSNRGVHFDKRLDDYFKEACQRRWMEREGATEDDFRAIFGRNYL